MTPQVQRVVVLLLVIGLVVLVPLALQSPEVRDSYVAGAGGALLLGNTWLWGSSAVLLWRRRGAGAVLLDLGRPHAERAAGVAGAVLSVALALCALVSPDLRGAVPALGCVTFALYMLLQSLLPFVGRAQLRAGGVVAPGQYIPWERIGSYAVRDRMAYMEVVIQYRTWLNFSGYPWAVTIRCPTSRWKEAAALLARHVPRTRLRSYPPGLR